MTSRTSRCLLCGAAIQRRNPNHRYCETCSKKWSTLNHRRRELAREAGLKANRESKRSVTLSEKSRCDLAWTVQVEVPFSYFASKNYIHQLSRSTGRVFVHRKSKSKRNEISAAIRNGLGEQRVAHNKLWIEILERLSFPCSVSAVSEVVGALGGGEVVQHGAQGGFQ